jgi:glutamyl-tRNA synthetase
VYAATVLNEQGEKHDLARRSRSTRSKAARRDGRTARLGWNHGDDEIFSRERFYGMIILGKSAAQFDEAKLRWVNAQHEGDDDDTARMRDAFLLSAEVASAYVAAAFKDAAALLELASWINRLVTGGPGDCKI